jgi:hypothetical protein
LTIEEISIISNNSHLEWRAELSDTILKGTLPHNFERDPPRFGVICFSGFREEDLNVIFYQNMPNLHNLYKSAERNIPQKNLEYMLNYSLPCSCSKNLSSFWLILKQQWTIEEISIFSNSSHLEWREELSNTKFERDPPKDHPSQVWCNLVPQFQRRFKCDLLSKYAYFE